MFATLLRVYGIQALAENKGNYKKVGEENKQASVFSAPAKARQCGRGVRARALRSRDPGFKTAF